MQEVCDVAVQKGVQCVVVLREKDVTFDHTDGVAENLNYAVDDNLSFVKVEEAQKQAE